MQFVALDAERIAYSSTGSGTPLVLVHGSFATSSAWKRLVAAVDGEASCIAVDLPGWGESMRPEEASVDLAAAAVEAVAQAFGDGPIQLAGHSHGGSIALAVALRARVAVRSLTLFEPLPLTLLAHTGDRGVVEEICGFVADYRRAFEAGDRWAARSVIELWGGAGAFEAMAASFREFIASGTAQNLRDWSSSFAFDFRREALERLRIPTTVVYGAASHRIAKLMARRLAEVMPAARLVEMPSASHFMIHTHAEECARLIELK